VTVCSRVERVEQDVSGVVDEDAMRSRAVTGNASTLVSCPAGQDTPSRKMLLTTLPANMSSHSRHRWRTHNGTALARVASRSRDLVAEKSRCLRAADSVLDQGLSRPIGHRVADGGQPCQMGPFITGLS
jgi:hypothetical protein